MNKQTIEGNEGKSNEYRSPRKHAQIAYQRKQVVEQKLRKEECAMATLLEQAKQAPAGRKRFQRNDNLTELFEVAMAYALGEISGKQAMVVIPGSRQNIHHSVGRIFLAAVKAGMLVRNEPL